MKKPGKISALQAFEKTFNKNKNESPLLLEK